MPSDPTGPESSPDPLDHLFNDSEGGDRPLSRRERRERERAQSSEGSAVDADTAASATGDAARHRAERDTSASSSSERNPVTSSLDALLIEAAGEDRSARRRRLSPEDKPRRNVKSIVLWTLLPLIVIGAIIASGFYVWQTFEPQIRSVMGWQEPIDYEGSGSGEVLVVIAEGDSGSDIAATLKESGVTKTSEAFYKLLLTQEPEPTFQPGTYSLKKKMSAQSALNALLDPDNKVERTAVIPEGLTGESILQRLSDATEISLDDLRAAAEKPTDFGIPESAPSIEGWLFPATYTFEPDLSAHDVIKILVDRTFQALDEAGVAEADRERVLTTASVIQREARQKDDFYKVSRVIQNRLEADMKLQMDSTAQYGVDAENDSVWSSQEALDSDNPWNTYKHKGLPIGPISSPGSLAIDAAINPADGDWIYFVTVNLDTGETIFSTTNAEHEKAVEKLRAWCKANPDRGC